MAALPQRHHHVGRCRRSWSRVCAGNRRECLVGVVIITLALPAYAEKEKPARKEYERVGKELVTALRTSLSKQQQEEQGSTRDDTAVRRAADPARELIQRLLARGAERDGRGETRSYAIFTSVVRDLGVFYRERGPRAVLDETLRLDILSRLDEAENLLAEHL